MGANAQDWRIEIGVGTPVSSISLPEFVADPGPSSINGAERVIHLDASEKQDGEIKHYAEDGGDILPRRWAGAQKTRFNASTWCGVQSTTINEDLALYLNVLRSRCRHEVSTNPMVEGMVNTHTIDLIGETGPTLLVESDNEQWNKDAREAWEEWFDVPTTEGLHGLDLLRRHNRGEWTDGNNLCQWVDFSRELPRDTVCPLRLFDISPDRLESSPGVYGDRFTTLGVTRDRWGRPRTYWIRNPQGQFTNSNDYHSYSDVAADNIIHVFDSLEAGQAIGVPRLASALQDIGDLREFDVEVLDAARASANNSMLLWTLQPEHVSNTQRVAAGTEMQLQRRTAKFIPAGYQATAMNAVHPTAQYIEFRHERLRSIGRAAHMPLLMILLSAEDSNFSQSRIDINVIYERGLGMTRCMRERKFLNPCAANVFRSMMLATRESKAGPVFRFNRAPQRFRVSWNWEPLKQANPKDAVLAIERMMALGLTTEEIEANKLGLNIDDLIASQVRCDEKRRKAGLPTISEIILSLKGGVDEEDPEKVETGKGGQPKSGQKPGMKVGAARMKVGSSHMEFA